MYQTETRPLEALTPAKHNSRLHSDDQIKQIAASLEQFGWTMPVLVDEEGVLIAGHARVRAATLLGWAEAPCKVATGWSEEQKIAYQIADNKLAENSTWDDDILREQIAMLQAGDFELDVLAFPDFQLDGILGGNTNELFTLPIEGADDAAPKNFITKEPSKTSDGMVQFSVVVPAAAKKAAFAHLRALIKAGEAKNYSEAFIIAMGVASGQNS